MHFDIEPFRGALPIRFGMTPADVHKILGDPDRSSGDLKAGKLTDYYHPIYLNVRYSKSGKVEHLGFAPGEGSLSIAGKALWKATDHADPNPVLLSLDPKPFESLGFWVYMEIGISTTGFHDDCPSDRSLCLFPDKAEWQRLLKNAQVADTSKYSTRVAKKPRARRPSR